MICFCFEWINSRWSVFTEKNHHFSFPIKRWDLEWILSIPLPQYSHSIYRVQSPIVNAGKRKIYIFILFMENNEFCILNGFGDNPGFYTSTALWFKWIKGVLRYRNMKWSLSLYIFLCFYLYNSFPHICIYLSIYLSIHLSDIGTGESFRAQRKCNTNKLKRFIELFNKIEI